MENCYCKLYYPLICSCYSFFICTEFVPSIIIAYFLSKNLKQSRRSRKSSPNNKTPTKHLISEKMTTSFGNNDYEGSDNEGNLFDFYEDYSSSDDDSLGSFILILERYLNILSSRSSVTKMDQIIIVTAIVHRNSKSIWTKKYL